MLRKIVDADECNTSYWRTRRYIEWLKETGVRGSEVESESQHMAQGFGEDGDSRSEYLEIFRNEVDIRAAEKFPEFSGKNCDHTGEVEGLVVWLVRVDACVGTRI